jgi:glycerol kinase
MRNYILAIDQGTTGSRAVLVDSGGQALAQENAEFRQIFPRPGWVEHDPGDIWASVASVVRGVFQKTSVKPAQLAAIGITNQRETVLLWDRASGKPIHNAIVWQCRRTAPFCERLKRRRLGRSIRQKTGLVIDPYFSASKIHWLLTNVDGARAAARNGRLIAGTIDTYLLWRLTGRAVHKTDVSNASRTMLMDLRTAAWDPALLELFAVPASALPEIAPSSGVFGSTRGLDFLPDGIPIAGIAGDQQAALFGQSCFKAGEAKCTFGTGSFLLMNTGRDLVRSKAGLLTTVAWQLAHPKNLTYALEGGAFVCGAAVQWLRDGLGFFSSSREVEELAGQVETTDGVEFVPALSGLGAPHWDAQARGLLSGLTRGTTRAHIARATLESMALQNADILSAMQKDLGRRLRKLRVDGGASANNLLMQIQADLLGVSIDRPRMIETTSAGAAYLAGLGVGFWSGIEEIEKIWQVERRFAPHLSARRRKERFERWNKAIRRARL